MVCQQNIYKISTIVPAIINNAPIVVFMVSASPKKITDSTIVIATLNLSTGATCETLPICNALIKYPRQAGGNTRNNQEKQVVLRQVCQTFCFAPCQHNAPGNQQDNNGTYGGCKV